MSTEYRKRKPRQPSKRYPVKPSAKKPRKPDTPAPAAPEAPAVSDAPVLTGRTSVDKLGLGGKAPGELKEAGLKTVAALRRHLKKHGTFTDIYGIGAAMDAKIKAAIGEV